MSKSIFQVSVTRTGIVFGQIWFPVLKTPFQLYPTVDLEDPGDPEYPVDLVDPVDPVVLVDPVDPVQ